MKQRYHGPSFVFITSTIYIHIVGIVRTPGAMVYALIIIIIIIHDNTSTHIHAHT